MRVIKHLGILILFFVGLCRISFSITQPQEDAKHTQVALRMIGHQLLLQIGDSISRIEQVEENNGVYTIKFESELSIVPEDLQRVVDSVAQSYTLAKNFILEVSKCAKSTVFYSFEKHLLDEENDIIPCTSRALPKACYVLMYTPLNESVSEGKNKLQVNENWLFGLLLLVALIPLTLYIKQKLFKNRLQDSHLLSLGLYVFDTRNEVLILDNTKEQLSAKEADLLLLLLKSVNELLTKEDILKQVWNDEGAYVGRTLDVYISKLRKKLEADTSISIVNNRGVGYKLVVNQ